MLAGDFAPGFAVDHFVKDMGIALAEARRMRLALPGLALAESLYVALQAHGHGRSGTQALVLALAELSKSDWPPRPSPPVSAGLRGSRSELVLHALDVVQLVLDHREVAAAHAPVAVAAQRRDRLLVALREDVAVELAKCARFGSSSVKRGSSSIFSSRSVVRFVTGPWNTISRGCGSKISLCGCTGSDTSSAAVAGGEPAELEQRVAVGSSSKMRRTSRSGPSSPARRG